MRVAEGKLIESTCNIKSRDADDKNSREELQSPLPIIALTIKAHAGRQDACFCVEANIPLCSNNPPKYLLQPDGETLPKRLLTQNQDLVLFNKTWSFFNAWTKRRTLAFGSNIGHWLFKPTRVEFRLLTSYQTCHRCLKSQ